MTRLAEHADFPDQLRALDAPPPVGGSPVDAAVEGRIRANVLRILAEMFRIHHAAAWEGRGRPELLGQDPSLPAGERVAAGWTAFAKGLRKDWEERLAADERFGRQAQARKGRVQLAALDDALGAWDRRRREAAR